MSPIRCEFQVWTAYSRCSFISTTFKTFQSEGSQLLNVLFRSLSILLTLFTTWFTLFFHFKSLAIITTKSLSVLLWPISFICSDMSPKIYEAFGLFLPKCSTVHSSRFSLKLHWLVHSVTATRALCIFLTSTSLFMTYSSFESSAKSFISHKEVSGRSLMYTPKKSGQRTEPFGTPLSTSDH